MRGSLVMAVGFRRFWSVGAAVVSAALLASLLAAPAQGSVLAAPAALGAADAKPAPVLERPDVVTAVMAARVQGSAVEVASARSAVARTWANPDGSLTQQSFTGPNWTTDAQGGWREIDTTLVAVGGVVAPRAAAVDVRLSAGGGPGPRDAGVAAAVTVAVPQDALAQIASAVKDADPARMPAISQAGAKPASLSIGWPGVLPAPVLDGATATYREVAPGRDLRVKVITSGIETFVDLTVPPVNVAKAGVAVSLPVSAQGLSLAGDDRGGVELRDARTAAVVGAGSAARIWDAAIDPVSGDPVHTTVVDTAVVKTATGWELVVVVPAAFLAIKGLTYPVTIDPSVSIGAARDTYVEKGYNTTNFGSEDDLKAGTYDGGTHVARSYVGFPLSNAAGFYDTAEKRTVVDSAYLKLWEWHAASCTPSTLEVRRPTADWTEGGATWNTKPAQSGVLASVSDAHRTDGTGGCAPDWVGSSSGINVTSLAQGWADGDYDNDGVAITASETNSGGWKRFRSSEYATASRRPSLVVTYRHKPNTPGSISVTPAAGSLGGYKGVAVHRVDPTVWTTVSDLDGGTVKALFDVYEVNQSTGATTLKASGKSGSTVTSGAQSGLTLQSSSIGFALADGHTYKVVARASDGSLTSAATGLSGAFTIDTSAPTVAGVSSTAFPAGAWAATGSGTFTFTSTAGDIAFWQYSFDGITWTSTTGGGSPKTTPTVTAAPGWNTLRVRATDIAGNTGPAVTYQFGVPAVTAPVEQAKTLRFQRLDATGPTSATGVRFQYQLAGATGWADVPAAEVTVAGNPIGSWPVATVAYPAAPATATGRSAPPELVWDMFSTLGGDAAVKVQAVFTTSSGASTTLNTPTVLLDSRAYGLMYASADVGAGSVSLLTGNLAVTGSDAAVASGAGGLSVTRTFNSADPAFTPPVGGVIFGPGWATSLESVESDWARLDYLGAAQVRLVDTDGGQWYFAKNGTSWAPVADAAVADLALTAGTGSPPATFTLTDPDGGTVSFTQVDTGTTASTAAPKRYRVQSSAQAGVVGTSSFTYNPDGTPKTLVAPAPSGVSCDPVIAAGCRVLAFTYTDADGAGDPVVTRLAKVTLKTTTSAGTAVSTDVACYSYDSASGYRLASVWDPREGGTSGWATTCGALVTSTATTYSYRADGRIDSIASAGLAPVAIGYTSSENRFDSVSRTHAGVGGATVASTIRYNVPIDVPATGDEAKHPDLSPTRIATWGQSDVPLTAAVVYGPGDTVSTDDLRDGVVHGIDADGRETNTAVYAGTGQDGWRIDTSEYDRHGNTIRTLSAANRDRALNPADYTGELTELGLAGKASDEIAAALDTRSFYSSDGTDLLDTFGPAHRAVLPDGTLDTVRAHTSSDYGTVDYPASTPTNWATQAPEHAPVATTTAASRSLAPVATNETDSRQTRYSYALTPSPADAAGKAGWNLRTPLATTVENGATDIVTVVVYDGDGNLVEQRQPSATAKADPGTRVTTYYGAGAHNPAACTSNAWYGQVCTISPGAQPATPAMPGLPLTRYSYDVLLRPTTVTETVTPAAGGSTTRTTTTTYANNGASARTDTVTVTGGDGTAVPATSYGYDPTTGLPVTTTAAGKTLTTGYDDFGQPASYTDSDGAKTLTERDNQDRISQIKWTDTDGTTLRGQASYAYRPNGTGGDHRGLLASLTDSDLGQITAGYDVAGNLTSQTLATGLAQSFTTNTTGATTSTTWTDAADHVLLTDTQTSDVHGRWTTQSLTGADPGWTGRDYGYDQAGRLTAVAEQHTVLGCQTRTYGFDINSNRTSRNTYPADSAGACTTSTTPAGQTLNYDNADRLTSTGPAAGISYDPWGRTTTLPAALTSTPAAGDATMGYYSDDLARSITQDGKTRTWTRDPGGRLAALVSSGLGATASLNHYPDPSSDSPAWTRDTDTAGAVTIHRYLTGLAGNLLADLATTGGAITKTVQLTGLHGDVLRTTSPGATGSPDGPAVDTDEYGQARDNTTGDLTTGPRFNWLGGKQRATDTGTIGLTLMGVRLYTPVTGRFLSTDPVYGGNPNAYSYPSNPITNYDLDGRWGLGDLGGWISEHSDVIKDVGKGIAVGLIVAAVCVGSAGIGCAVGVGLIAGAALGVADYHFSNRNHSLRGYARAAAVGGLSGALNGAAGFARAGVVARQAQRYGSRTLHYEARFGAHMRGRAGKVRSYMSSRAFAKNQLYVARHYRWTGRGD